MDVHSAARLGENALAYTLLSYGAIMLHRRVVSFPIFVQSLQEEKDRGITIDLGFAHTTQDDAVLSFSFPDRLLTGAPLTDLETIEVYRVVKPSPALTGFLF